MIIHVGALSRGLVHGHAGATAAAEDEGDPHVVEDGVARGLLVGSLGLLVLAQDLGQGLLGDLVDLGSLGRQLLCLLLLPALLLLLGQGH
jgi:hypothetical protein